MKVCAVKQPFHQFRQPSRWFASLLDLLYPPHCVACRCAGAWFCDRCLESIPTFAPPLCQHCGRPLPATHGPAQALCPACQQQYSPLQGVRSVGPHLAPLREAIHAFKYEGVRVLAGPLGQLLARTWQRGSVPVDVVLPVPLHRARLRQRGYNQTLLLARVLGAEVGLPVREDGLVRQRNTRAQVGLSPDQRRANVQDAFVCLTPDLRGQRVLLIDDVFTTGATLEACATALRLAGVREVWALTLTRAVGTTDGKPS